MSLEAMPTAESELSWRVSAQRELPDHRASEGGAHVQACYDIRQEYAYWSSWSQRHCQHQSQCLAGLFPGPGSSDLPRRPADGRSDPLGVLRRSTAAGDRTWTRHAGGVPQLAGRDTAGRVVPATRARATCDLRRLGRSGLRQGSARLPLFRQWYRRR